VSMFTETLVNNFISTTSKLQIPMFEVVSQQLRSRVQKQMSQVFPAPQEGVEPNSSSFSVTRLCHFLLDCVGLIPETGRSEATPGSSYVPCSLPDAGLKSNRPCANREQPSSPPQLSLCRDYDLIPDVSPQAMTFPPYNHFCLAPRPLASKPIIHCWLIVKPSSAVLTAFSERRRGQYRKPVSKA
jgi:hypothetical protein